MRLIDSIQGDRSPFARRGPEGATGRAQAVIMFGIHVGAKEG